VRLTYPLKPFPAGWLGYIPFKTNLQLGMVLNQNRQLVILLGSHLSLCAVCARLSFQFCACVGCGGLQHIAFVAQGYLGHSGVGAVTAWSSYVGGNLHVFSVRAAQLSLQLGVLGCFC